VLVSSLATVERDQPLDDPQGGLTCLQDSILDRVRNDQLKDVHVARLSDTVSSIESLFLFQGG
jgi:hypothetical protein